MGVHDDDYNDEEETEEEEEEETSDNSDDDDSDDDSDDDGSDDDDDSSDDDSDDDDSDDDDSDDSSSSSNQGYEDFDLDDHEEEQSASSERSQIELADLRRLAESGSPELAQALLEFWQLGDPPQQGKKPEGALDSWEFTSQLRQLRWKPAAEKGKLAQEILRKFLKNKDWPPPPRFLISDFLVQLYNQNTETARAAILHVIKEGNLQFGLWGGLKRIYKLSEERLDAEMFGALTWRFDSEFMTAPRRRGYGYRYRAQKPRDVSQGTMVYLKRRAWRFLKGLGRQVPDLYPQFAAQVLRHYNEETNWNQSWVGNHILAHDSKKYGPYSFYYNVEESKELVKVRAFEDAWKRSPEPLMQLLEAAQADPVVKFAIQCLKKDFPEALRTVTADWLERLAKRPLGSAHDFVVDTLKNTPEFHQAKLKALGLHEAVLILLESSSDKAREYAVEYARAHAQDLENERLAKLAQSEHKDTRELAVEMLEGRPAKKMGYAFLGKLIAIDATQKFAKKALNDHFDRKDIPQDFLIEMIYASDPQREWVGSYLKAKYQPGEITADFWKNIIDDKRREGNDEAYNAIEFAMEELGKFSTSAIGSNWILDALQRDDLNYTVQRWLKKADSLPGLDLDKLKGLAIHRKYRQIALELLGNTKLIKPRELGLSWLLALARRNDQELNQFAGRYLLENLKPADFSDNNDKEAGIEKLFALATGEKEPDAVRAFAQTYLRCHHPEVSKDQKESKEFGIKPNLGGKNIYTADRIWKFLFDTRPDVRKFAADITKAELRHWGYHTKIYELVDQDAKEVRNIAYNALLKAGNPKADLVCTLKPEEFDADKIFSMTESRKRPTREVGMEMVRVHYDRLGGPERLARLMQSPDREIRLFAVRVLWERHRPSALPKDWKPNTKSEEAKNFTIPDGRFENVEALQGFLRRVLYGLPPGRSMESKDNDAAARRLSASAAKRSVIEVVRDLAVQEVSFAKVVLPLFEEFSGSLAKGEWEACVTALVQLRKAHAELR